MALADPAARYRNYAANCVVIAQMLADVAEKLSLVDMAQGWITLAEQAQEYASLCGIHENYAEPDRPLRVLQGIRPSSSARPNRRVT